jgi:imidazolonepropionase-like amidohydrolase
VTSFSGILTQPFNCSEMPVKIIQSCSIALFSVGLVACASVPSTTTSNSASAPAAEHVSPFDSTYTIPSAPAYVLSGATVLTGSGEQLDDASVVFADGKIVAVGNQVDVPEGAVSIDARGKWITPGIIDVHSHMGVYPNPSVESHSDGNEMVAPATAKVWAEHSVWPQDPNFEKALAGGVTTAQILPGSANLFGGRGVTLKTVPSVTMMGMKFPDAPHALKMACGENPKRVYGEKGGPGTRMGNMAGYRSAWIAAKSYDKLWDEYEAKVANGDKSAQAPERNLEMETLRGVLDGEIKIHNHCYRADEMANMIELSKEFGYQISAFHHAVEAYKIAPLLAENDICAVVWADWWGFKQEAYDMIRENAALIEYAKGCAIIHSDDETQIQRLPQEVGKVVSAAKQIGIDIPVGTAIKWLTSNSAKSIGLDDRIGSLAPGMNADVVLWSGNPLSVYSKADKVWVDGALRFDRDNADVNTISDFNLGIIAPTEDRP